MPRIKQKHSPAFLETIRERYPKEGANRLAPELGHSRWYIQKLAKEMGLQSETSQAVCKRQNQVSLKVDYFSIWSVEVAYDLGYLVADGCVSLGEHANLLLECQRGDEEIILGIRERLGSNHEICRRVRVQRSGYKSLMTRVQITSLPLVLDLIHRHHVVPSKSTKVIQLPEAPPALWCHFARGWMDGDGCISSSDKRCVDPTFQVYWAGQEDNLLTLQRVVKEQTGVDPNQLTSPYDQSKIKVAAWSAIEDLRELRSWLYPLGKYPYLTRKRLKLETL